MTIRTVRSLPYSCPYCNLDVVYLGLFRCVGLLVNHLDISYGVDLCKVYIYTDTPAFLGIYKLGKSVGSLLLDLIVYLRVLLKSQCWYQAVICSSMHVWKYVLNLNDTINFVQGTVPLVPLLRLYISKWY